MTLPHQQDAVAEMTARSDFDLAAGPEKGELDAALLTFLISILFSFFCASWSMGRSGASLRFPLLSRGRLFVCGATQGDGSW
jgi:hypothetical protein